MPTPTKGPRLGGSPSHQKAILANLAQSLFEHGRITTTEAKAKRLRPYAEKLITAAKRGDLHARRNVARDIRRKDVLHVLFAEIGPRFANRPGGYTRITKLNPRQGDNAPMALIELVEPLAEGVIAEATGATKRAAKEKAAQAAAPAAAPVETAVEAEVAAEEAVEEVVEETAAEVAEIAAEDAEATESDADGEAKA